MQRDGTQRRGRHSERSRGAGDTSDGPTMRCSGRCCRSTTPNCPTTMPMDRRRDDLYAAGAAHLHLGRRRRPGRDPRARCSRRTSNATVGIRRVRCCSSSPTTSRSSSTPCGWCSIATTSASTCSCIRPCRSSATPTGSSPRSSDEPTRDERGRGVDADRTRPLLGRRPIDRSNVKSPPRSPRCTSSSTTSRRCRLGCSRWPMATRCVALARRRPPRAAGVGDLSAVDRRAGGRAGARARVGPRPAPPRCAARRHHGRPTEPRR